MHESSYQVYVTCVLSELVMKRAEGMIVAFPGRALLPLRPPAGTRAEGEREGEAPPSHYLFSESCTATTHTHMQQAHTERVVDPDQWRRDGFRSHWFLQRAHTRLFFLLDMCDMADNPYLLRIVTTSADSAASFDHHHGHLRRRHGGRQEEATDAFPVRGTLETNPEERDARHRPAVTVIVAMEVERKWTWSKSQNKSKASSALADIFPPPSELRASSFGSPSALFLLIS